ncbi:hypothetical protein ABPG72_014539 [Tetrahymena utriculariae]
MELKINGKFEFSNDFSYNTQLILDYSDISNKILDTLDKFFGNSTSENINGICQRRQHSSIFVCRIQLNRKENSRQFSKIIFDYISKYNDNYQQEINKQKLFEHYKDFEDQLFQSSYIEKIKNKCFQRLSSQSFVFIPISQVYEQRIVDQLIQNNDAKNKVNVIHYFQGVKTMKEFEEILNITISQKYPVITKQKSDNFYTDLRSQYVNHYFLGDIRVQEFSQNNKPILKWLNDQVTTDADIDLVDSLTYCLNQEIPKYFKIISKNNLTNANDLYNFTSNKFTFNQENFEMQTVNQQISQYKYIIFKQNSEQKIRIVYKILLYLGGDIQIIDKKVIQRNMKQNIFRIAYKYNIFEFQSNQQQTCNQFLPSFKYSLELQLIDINLGNGIQIDPKNKTIIFEKKKQGSYLFTINLLQDQV